MRIAATRGEMWAGAGGSFRTWGDHVVEVRKEMRQPRGSWVLLSGSRASGRSSGTGGR